MPNYHAAWPLRDDTNAHGSQWKGRALTKGASCWPLQPSVEVAATLCPFSQAEYGGSHLEVEPSIHEPRDENTADSWIERNQSLIRLTGKHPFNCEAPLARLMHHGFVTLIPLHYVRSHGAVPKADWALGRSSPPAW
ncbi:hypothetical protein OPV22_006523 [Ensete ventricosum]|uniref:Uncharacterized protein n=1 Tax=Ensete ventricosum TaxID=4639 RepID=A0AAV8RLI5_ENSVE|nr:hypothetical protein OPV22_006523 [Ensete ventricosum]